MCQKSCPVGHLNAHIHADFNLEHVSILNIPWSKSEVFFEQILTIFRNFDQKVTFWKSKIENVMLILNNIYTIDTMGREAPHFINFLCKNQNHHNMFNFYIFKMSLFDQSFWKLSKFAQKKLNFSIRGYSKLTHSPNWNLQGYKHLNVQPDKTSDTPFKSSVC